MSDEQAKAVQEVAKTSGKLVEAAEKVGGFVSKIVGGASTQVGGILEDWAKYYRYKNLLAIADKVEVLHAQRKLEGKTIPIPPRAAIPMLESASLEDDEVLQEVWARLIANSTDPNFKESLHPGYIEIVKQISPDEAIILNSFLKIKVYPILFKDHVSEKYDHTGLRGYWYGYEQGKASYEGVYELYVHYCKSIPLKEPSNALVYLDNLQRLRIVELGHDFSGKEKSDVLGFGRRIPSGEKPRPISVPARDEYLRMTTFGKHFIEACISEEVHSSRA